MLVCYRLLAPRKTGLMSYGNGCAYENGVYTDVAAYRDWIDEEAGPSCEDAEDWHKTDDPDKDCQWVAGKPETRGAVKGPGWGQDSLMASYACKSVCGGACEDSGSWHKNGEDWKGCARVSIFPEKRCSVRGEDNVLAATACPDSCA